MRLGANEMASRARMQLEPLFHAGLTRTDVLRRQC
jgi:hypothetical protein